ncbi:hypothetical protein [Thermoactinospora rubra]|uniref:hypothetical protein n=1 Tax=Thermoactinospora rubra TaxID=1088767 RepID=UPI000A1019E5|nr:hypothetical protein [Thermoactinospora rubra]
MSIQDELRQVDEDLAKLRASAADLREQISDMGPGDAVDRASMMTMAEEQERLIADLQARREQLQRRLDGAT